MPLVPYLNKRNRLDLGRENLIGCIRHSKAGVCPALSVYDRICNRPTVGDEMLIQLVLFLQICLEAYQGDKGVIPQVF